MDLGKEALLLHENLFGKPPHPAIVNLYREAHSKNTQLPAATRSECLTLETVHKLNMSPVAAEFWVRRKCPGNSLTKKIVLISALNECLEGDIRRRGELGFAKLCLVLVGDALVLCWTGVRLKAHGLI